MDASQAEQLSELIITGLIQQSWKLQILTLVLMLVAGAIGSWVASYFRARGERYATKADFKELLSELETMTNATESIKSNLEHETWAAKEEKLIKRQKLEELVTAMHETSLWLNAERSFQIFDGEKNDLPKTTHKVNIMGKLYFPELEAELNAYTKAISDYEIWIISKSAATRKAKITENKDDLIGAMKTASDEFKEVYLPVIKAINALEGRAEIIMRKVIQTSKGDKV